jgi:hypothetical protein
MMRGVKTVLHIGSPKTGTTAVQAALAELDQTDTGLAGYGISMPGTPLLQARAALSLLQQGVGWAPEDTVPGRALWPRLVAEAESAPGTVFISSEYLCEAQPGTIRRVVDDLGPDLHVVLTLRPLGRILPSAWQQYLKSGHQLPYEKWLSAVLSGAPTSTTPSFWRRHDQATVLERWAEVVGADRMRVVVLDPNDRGLLFRAFEDALGLPSTVLTEGPAVRQNRSMSVPEAELYRRLNAVLRTKKLPWDDYSHLVRYGAILRTVENYSPPPDAPGLSTPDWALERAAHLGRDYVNRIRALQDHGLQVVGDLEHLAERGAGPVTAPITPDLVPIDAAVQALLGTISRAAYGVAFFADEVNPEELAAQGMPGYGRELIKILPVHRLSNRQLVGVIIRRIRFAVRWRRWRLRRKLRALVPRWMRRSDADLTSTGPPAPGAGPAPTGPSMIDLRRPANGRLDVPDPRLDQTLDSAAE